MPTRYDITEDVVSYLGISPELNPSYANTKFNYDYAFNGIPFLTATSEQYPYRRQLIDIRKQQFDASNDPGEQSLSGWWLRSQSTFTGGAGIKFVEPTSDERVMRSYSYSYGLDVWTDGQVTLLNAMASTSTSQKFMCVFSDNGTERIATASTTTITIRDTAGASVTTVGVAAVSGTIIGIASVGDRFIVWTDTNKIYYYDRATTAMVQHHSFSSGTLQYVWFVKNRLIIALSSELKELPITWGSGAQSDVSTAPNTSWTWTSVIETPSGFLASGYSGNYSAIYQIGLSTAGVIVSLTAPRISAEMPLGETVRALRGYLGSYVGIGTSKGFRVGTVDSNGFLTYGPLIATTINPVTHITANDRFMWFGAQSAVNGSTGTYRIDLSNPDGSGFFPYAGDVVTTGTEAIQNLAMLANGKMVLSTSGGNLWIEGATKVTTGTLRTGLIRYSTIEAKVFKRIRVRGYIPNGTSIAVSSVDQTGGVVSLIPLSQANIGGDVQIIPSTPLDCLAFQFDITGSGSDSPTLYGYQVKALPAVDKGENIQVNLLCFDYETDKHGTRIGIEGSSKVRYELLRESVKNGDTVTMQNLNTEEDIIVVIDGLDFTQTAPPRPGMSGFGGILTITARTIV